MDLDINVVQTITCSEAVVNGSYVLRRDVYYIDYTNGAAGNDGRSWATAKNRLNDITVQNAHVYIAKSPDPVSLGNITFTDNTETLVLASAKTLTVSDCNSAWSVVTNITQANETTNRKQGTYARAITVGSSFTTGKMAYVQIGGGSAIDYSSYAKLTFWIRVSVAVTASYLKLCLCSDIAGDTIVDNFTIPYKLEAGVFYPITLTRDGGGALGSSIQSVAIYALTDPGTPVIYLDNIEAANDLHLGSLIGKNTENEHWFSIKSILGTDVYIGYNSDTPVNIRKYYGTTGTVTGYCRDTVITKDHLGTSTSMAVQTVGQYNNWEVTGGFNTATGVRDGITFFDGLNTWGYGFTNATNSCAQWIIKYLGFVRYYRGISVDNQSFYRTIWKYIWSISCNYGFYIASWGGNFNKFKCANCNNAMALEVGLRHVGWVDDSGSPLQVGFEDIRVIHCGWWQTIGNFNTVDIIKEIWIEGAAQSYSLYFNAFGQLSFNVWQNVNIRYGSYGIGCYDGEFRDFKLSYNTSAAIYVYIMNHLKMIHGEFVANAYTCAFASPGQAVVEIYDCLSSDTAETNTNLKSSTSCPNAKLIFHNKNRVAGVHHTLKSFGDIKTNTADYRTASPCLEMAKWSNGDAYRPLTHRLQVPIESGQARTIKFWMKRASGFTGRSFGRVLLNEQEVVTPIELFLTTTYQQFTFNVPSAAATENGVYELELQLYGAVSASCFVDDLTWS
jgi:hypothetical protein